jgi:O-antigen/teichoic acid export membrane protein
MRSRPLVRNVLFNFIGQTAPLLAAAVTLPTLAHTFGIDRLGVLTLAWVLLGSFGLLDFGLGRSLTQSVAARLATDRAHELPVEIVTSWFVLAVLGAGAGLALALATPRIVADVLTVPAGLEEETRHSLYALAAGLPFLTLSSGMRGLLEAQQRFDLVNFVRMPLGLLTYLGPLLVLPFTRSVAAAVTVIAASRVLACVAYLVFCLRGWPHLRVSHLRTSALKRLAGTGMWMTIANIAGTLIAYLDRFVLGALATLATVAYYATPQELITKLTVVPMSVSGVLFPVFSAAAASGNPGLRGLFGKMSTYIFVLLAPVTLTGAAFAPELLRIWLGGDFSAASAQAVRWFCFGVLLNSLAVAPMSLLQAVGRADLTAKLQLLQMPLYFGALWWVTQQFGSIGTAVIWGTRMLLDATILFAASRQLLPDPGPLYRRFAMMLVATVAVFGVLLVAPGLASRIFVFVTALVLLAGWLPQLLTKDDRDYAVLALRRLRSRPV